MSAEGGGVEATTADAERTASRLRGAEFVRMTAQPSGDALAATGLIVAGLRAAGVPFQARVRPATDVGRHAGADGGDGTFVVRVGDDTGTPDAVVGSESRPASVAARSIAARLGAEPRTTLALAGARAAQHHPAAGDVAGALETARQQGTVRCRPGVAVPVGDVVDGLAHATRLSAPFSGDPEAVRRLVGDAVESDDARRRVASLVAVEAAAGGAESAATAVSDVLRPYVTPDGPFETVGGEADVLDAVAREAPGVGISFALSDGTGTEAGAAALEAWRTHGRAVHGLLDGAATTRHSGLLIARTEGKRPRLATAARLLRDFKSPEPAALVVGRDAARASGDGSADLGAAAEVAADALELDVATAGDRGRAVVEFDPTADVDVDAFVTAFRRAL